MTNFRRSYMKKNVKSMRKWALLSLSTVLLLVDLSACSFFQGQSIDGNWNKPSLIIFFTTTTNALKQN